MKPKDWAAIKPETPCTQGVQWRARFGTHVEDGVEYCCSCGGVVDEQSPEVLEWQENRRWPPGASADPEPVHSVRLETAVGSEGSYRVLTIAIRHAREFLVVVTDSAPADSFRSALRVNSSQFDDLVAVLGSGLPALVSWIANKEEGLTSVHAYATISQVQEGKVERSGPAFGLGVGVGIPLDF